MSASGFTPISLYYSTTASAVPTAANLVPGELAINTNDGKLYYEDSSGVVQVLATKSTGSIGGSNTQVQFNNSGSLGGSSGLTWDGSFLTTSSIKNSALTSGRVTYAGASGLLTDSSGLTFDGSTLTVTRATAGKVFEALSSAGASYIYSTFGAASSVFGQDSTGTFFGDLGTKPIYFYTNSAERMRITSAGNVGIGTSSPNAKLDVQGSILSTSFVRIGNPGELSVLMGTNSSVLGSGSSNDGTFYAGSGLNIRFYTSEIERMRLDSSGNLGLGATTPVAKLHVKGSGTSGQVTSSFILENSSSGTGGMDITGSAGASRWRFLYGGGPSTGTNALTESMCILTEGAGAGRVGIGTSSPNSKLTVNGGQVRILSSTAVLSNPLDNGSFSGQVIVNTNDGAGDLSGIGMYVNSSYGAACGIFAKQTSSTTADLTFFTGSGVGASNAERMRITSDGHLLVGTTSDFNSAFTMSLKVNSSTGGLIIQPGADSYTAIQFNNAAGTGVGSISVSSTLTSYNVTSDERLKTNVIDAPTGNIDDIKVRSFDWLSDGSHQEYGMVAQELIEVAPYAVTKPKNPDDMMQVDYSKLVPMMIKEIQDLKQRIATLENK